MGQWRGKSKLLGKAKRRASGIVYIIRIRLRTGEIIWKIGQTTRKVLHRIQEITADYFVKYGYVPMVEVVKQGRSKWYIEVEKDLLDRTSKWKYTASKMVQGVTEMRKGMDENTVLEWYRETMGKAYVVELPKIRTSIEGINDTDPIIY